MPAFFEKQPTIFVYGDGDGNIVFEEWSNDECSEILKSFSMSRQRFEDIVHYHFDDLCQESYNNPNLPKGEKSE